MSYKNHAEQEFLSAGWTDEKGKFNDKWQEFICKQVMELLDKFSEHGHSGSSAPYAVNLFKKLALFKPITPIKCTDNEWNKIRGADTFQNKRLSSVFKDGEKGKPYYLDAIVFRGQNENCFTSGNVSLKNGSLIGSSQYIKLPFIPKTFYIDVIETEWEDKNETIKKKGGGWWTSIVKDENQLKEVFEYYNEFKK